MASYKNGEDFLNKLYKELLFSKEVERTKENKDKPYESIRRYMQRLEKLKNK